MSKLSEQREDEAPARKSGPRWVWMIALMVVLLAAWIAYGVYNANFGKVSTLDTFAKCLTAKGAQMYGAWWCPHCAEQKELFGYAFQYVKYHECSLEGQRTETEECKQAGIQHFPTWQFPDGSRTEGTLQLSVLSQKTGCKLSQ
ncbi:MAG TPA: hypothetical protein VF123_02170 [Candidatus Sulfotelmatobacter sp.]